MKPTDLAALEPEKVIGLLSDRDVIALTLFGEARGEGPEGRIAVANVLRNRQQTGHFGGPTFRGICLQREQFSCWLESDPNRSVLIDTGRLLIVGHGPGPILRECQWIADGMLGSAFVDNTKGATHYLTAALYATSPPSWATSARVLAHIGGHLFMRAA